MQYPNGHETPRVSGSRRLAVIKQSVVILECCSPGSRRCLFRHQTKCRHSELDSESTSCVVAVSKHIYRARQNNF